jgi:hypothetical protein
MAWKLHVDAPAHGRSRKARITVLDEGERLVYDDEENLASVEGRRKAAKRLAASLNRNPAAGLPKDPAALEQLLEAEWLKAVNRQNTEQQQATQAPVSVGEYLVVANRVCMRKQTATGPVVIPLANFRARITGETILDFGNGEQLHNFQVEGTLDDGTALPTTTVPSGQFAALNWVPEKWGHKAVCYAGQGTKDHLRCALQLLSAGATREVIFQHTGWRQEGGAYFYLHGGGAIGPLGPVPSVRVGLPAQLQHAVLPDPPAGPALTEAVRASLRILDLGPDRITVAVGGAAYRAVLGRSDFSVHFCGPSGAYKTELAALVQQHHGAGFDSRNLPANWSSTANATEGLAFAAKDMVLVIDDFAPAGATADIARIHKEADRVFRNTGNQASRQRMAADGSLRPPRPPRCLPVSTGEDIPRGHSCRARVITVEAARGEIDSARLSACQADAAGGLYALALAGFIGWLAPRYGDVQAGLGAELIGLRTELQAKDQHRRTGANLAHLLLGCRYFLSFARDVGAISEAERQAYWSRIQAAVAQIGAEQHAGQLDAEPASQFLRLLRACITSEKAHVADPNGGEPDDHPEAWGWRLHALGSGGGERQGWQPLGERIGWLDGDALLIDPESSHAAAQKLAVAKGESLPLSSATLGKRLQEGGLLTEVEPEHRTVRRLIQGRRQRVWCLAAHGFFSLGPESGPDSGGKRSTGTGPGTGPEGNRSTETAQKHEENGVVDRLDRFFEGGEGSAEGSGEGSACGV